jgi:hypothetical protein
MINKKLAERKQQQYMNTYAKLFVDYATTYPRTEIATMPPSLLADLRDLIKFKACYNNVFNIATTLHVIGHDVAYVVGIAESVIPVDHAWIKIDGYYYDPTWQQFTSIEKGGYHAVAELSIDHLEEIIIDNGSIPPSAVDMVFKFKHFTE